MAISKGLSGLRKLKEEAAARREQFNTPKVEWFSLKGRPNGAKIMFLQELDVDGENYDSERGIPIVVVEHVAPGKEGWKSRAECSFEAEGRCYACEMHRANPQEGWKQRHNLYINIIDDDGVVKVLSRNINNSFIEWITEWFSDTGTVIGQAFKIKQTGEGFQTAWTAMPTSLDVDTTNVELYDLEKTVVKSVPYVEQEAFYARGYTAPEEKEASASSTEIEW